MAVVIFRSSIYGGYGSTHTIHEPLLVALYPEHDAVAANNGRGNEPGVEDVSEEGPRLTERVCSQRRTLIRNESGISQRNS